VQVTLEAGTAPFEVAGLNVQVTVRTTVGGGCSMVMTALVKDMSVMISVHDELGQSGAPGIGVVGEFVVTLNGVLPFLTSLAGMDTLPVTVTGAGFCPGAWNVLPPGFPHVPVGFATAEMLTSTSPNPSPESSPDAVRVRPLSVNAGCEWSPFKCTLLANAGVVRTVARANRVKIAHNLRIFFSPLFLGTFLIAPLLGARDKLAWKETPCKFVGQHSLGTYLKRQQTTARKTVSLQESA